jgi:hypothetical protein
MIINEEKKSIESKVVNKLFENEKYRFAILNNEEISDIPDNLWKIGYRFKQHFVKQSPEYFIPRGHNTVKTASFAKGYVHGGATPEEVLVPAALFKSAKLEWQSPSARILEPKAEVTTGAFVFYVLRIALIKIEIVNTNKEKIRILRVDVVKPHAEIKNCNALSVAANEKGMIFIECYFNKDALQETELVLMVNYEIAGEERVFEIQTKAHFKSATTGGFSLKDLK